MTHRLAQVSPSLSGRRCASITRWISRTFGGNAFVTRFNWQAAGMHDYPSIILHPMDLGKVTRYCEGDAFDFSDFLDMVRLVWENACRYYTSGSDMHDLATRLCTLTEDIIITAQEHPGDDNPLCVTRIYLPIVSTLAQCDELAPFLNPIDLNMAPGYDQVIQRAICLSEIRTQLEHNKYYSRYDVERDGARRRTRSVAAKLSPRAFFVLFAVLLISSNAMNYNPPDHPYHSLAMEMQTFAFRLMDAGRPDMDSRYMITSQMRQQLNANIDTLLTEHPEKVTQLTIFMQNACVDSIDNGDIIVDALTVPSFIKVDLQVRKWIVDAEISEGDDMHSAKRSRVS